MTAEEILANQMSIIGGVDSVHKALLSGDLENIVKTFDEKGIAPEVTISILHSMKYDVEQKKKSKTSGFAELQHTLVESVVGSKSISNKALEQLSYFVIEDSMYLEEEINYPNLGMYKDRELLKEFMNLEKEQSKNL